MDKIISTIEQLRIKQNVRKTVLCTASGISTAMYTKYLKGSNVPYHKAESMLKYLGYNLSISIPINT